MFCTMHMHTTLDTPHRGVFRILSDIYDGVFLRKWLAANNFNTSLFRNKGIIKNPT